MGMDYFFGCGWGWTTFVCFIFIFATIKYLLIANYENLIVESSCWSIVKIKIIKIFNGYLKKDPYFKDSLSEGIN